MDFILVGGVCAVLHGAPVTTFDLDLVHSRAPENIERLLASLRDLDAFYRVRKDIRVIPDESHLRSSGHQLLMTRFGPLDLLGTIGKGHAYEDLAKHTEKLEVDGMTIYVLTLRKLIEVKEETIREKDKALLLILRQTLKEKSKK